MRTIGALHVISVAQQGQGANAVNRLLVSFLLSSSLLFEHVFDELCQFVGQISAVVV